MGGQLSFSSHFANQAPQDLWDIYMTEMLCGDHPATIEALCITVVRLDRGAQYHAGRSVTSKDYGSCPVATIHTATVHTRYPSPNQSSDGSGGPIVSTCFWWSCRPRPGPCAQSTPGHALPAVHSSDCPRSPQGTVQGSIGFVHRWGLERSWVVQQLYSQRVGAAAS